MSMKPAHHRSAHEVLRERCRELGLPTWRCDAQGQVLDEPSEQGLVGLWLRSATVARLLTEATTRWLNQAEPEVVGVMPGCWLVALPEDHRRKRVAYTVVMALGPELLNADEFLDSCASSRLDILSTRRALLPSASYRAGSASDLSRALRWMFADLDKSGRDDSSIQGFTRQLTDSYETIDMLYALGRAMREIDRPEGYVMAACQRVHTTLRFGWTAAVFSKGPGLPPMLVGRVVISGDAPGAPERIEPLLARLVATLTADPKFSIHHDIAGLTDDAQPQLLVQPLVREDRILGAVIAGGKRGDDTQISSYDIQLIEAAAGFVSAFVENAALYEAQRDLFMGTLRALTSSIDAKDRYTRGHSERVALMSERLALAIGMSAEQAERIRIAAIVHDVGKIGVPEGVLAKPGRLTDEEFALIKLHPEIGHGILKGIAPMQDVLPGVLHHHERWDGRGYPHGLAGESIPLMARILALADTFDAMSSTRSYRAAMPRDKVLAELVRCAGSQFDPALAHAFVKLELNEYDAMVERHRAAEPGIDKAAA